MATIAVDTFLDDGTARTAGETWTVNSGAKLTVRTDTRWHSNSPTSMTGTLGSQTINEGEIIYDGRNVRWIAITGGSGTSAVGTTITQGVVSGYFLGFWSSLTAAPSTTIGSTGFIKLRERTGGSYTAGALTFSAGTGAATVVSDNVGWIEVVGDDSATITVPRLGKHTIRGDWFYLDNTNGSIGQTIQLPTNGGGANTYCPGVWIEDSPNSGTYDYFPSLNGATNGWAKHHLGAAHTEQDRRQRFVKDIGGGQVQIGETVDSSATFLNVAAQTGTYASLGHSCTYTWIGDVVTVSYPTGHLLNTGHSVALDFTSGGATSNDSNYIITVLDAFTYTVPLSGSGTAGNVTARPGITVSITAHTLGVGDLIYCDFTSGSGVDGNYEIYAVTSANAFLIKYASTANLTGNISVHSRYRIVNQGHSLSAGNRVYLDFTSGTGTDGLYTVLYPAITYLVSASAAYTWVANVVQVTATAHGMKVGDVVYIDFTSGAGTPDGLYTITAVAANTFNFTLAGSGTAGNCTWHLSSFEVIANNAATGSTGDVTIKQVIGEVPQIGCKIRIPNVILRGCATATRASNNVNAAIAVRPEWATTSAGAIDFEYAYTTWYMNFAQPYSVRLINSTTYDSLLITECATALNLNDCHVSMYGGLDTNTLILTSNFAGGTITNCKFHRGNTPGITDHAATISYCKNIIFTNVSAGIIQFNRSTGKALNLSYCDGVSLINCNIFSSDLPLSTCSNITVTNHNHVDRYIGYTNVTTPYYAILIGAGCYNVLVDGVSWGYGNSIVNIHPVSGLVGVTNAFNVKIRNVGSKTTPLFCGTFRPNYYGLGYVYATNGNNSNIKLQRLYVDNIRTALVNTINSDKNILLESVQGGRLAMGAMTNFTLADAALNSNIKGCMYADINTSGQSSVYGTHFEDMFLGDTYGKVILNMNEPTSETASYFTMVSGVAKWNSAGGILMGVIGNQAVWEDSVFRLGHTGFQNTASVMTGGTASNYTLEYQINTGGGYSDWKTLDGSNLSGETISPTTGFKIKIRITTTSTNTVAITGIRLNTTTSNSAQVNGLYPLDLATLSLYGIVTGSDIVVLSAGTTTEIANVDSVSGTTYNVEVNPITYPSIDVCVYKKGRIPFTLRGLTFTSAGLSLPITQTVDRNYID